MERGVIVMEGPPQAIFAQGEQLEAIGLGVPEMTALMGKLRAKGWDVPDSALTVEEAEAAIMAVLRREARVGTGGDI
jgi:energy-coupling factor transport system ATP-binding protein